MYILIVSLRLGGSLDSCEKGIFRARIVSAKKRNIVEEVKKAES